jgi:hypothetical protein
LFVDVILANPELVAVVIVEGLTEGSTDCEEEYIFVFETDDVSDITLLTDAVFKDV